MFVLSHRLKIGGYGLPAVKHVRIETSRETISDTAVIELPRYKSLKTSDIKEGDPVLFEAGYARYGLAVEFEGVVRDVSPDLPLKITAEDYFYYLRRDIISKTFRNMKAGDIVKQLCEGTPIDTSQVKSGINIKYRVYWNKSKRYIILDLAKKCGFDAFMDGKALVFKKPFADTGNYPVPIYRYGLNVIQENISSQVDAEYDRVVVISESTDGKGNVFRAVKGSGKKSKTFYFDNLSKSETINRAKELYEELSYKGFKGDFNTFGYPQTRHSRKIKFEDQRYPDKSGYYYVDKVEKEYGDNGYRQKIYLGRMAS